LSWVSHYEDPLMFSHRLQAYLPARRLFVSRSTATKYQCHIHQLTRRRSRRADELREAVIA